MVRTTLYLKKYDWTVYAYIAVHEYYTYEILERMRTIGAGIDDIQRAHANLVGGNIDNGLAYSNINERKTVLVIGLTSSAMQFMNSMVHEIRHLQQHIANSFMIDENSEEVCYMCGDIAMALFPYCKRMLCDNCRNE